MNKRHLGSYKFWQMLRKRNIVKRAYDVILIANGRRIRAHQHILSANSDYFALMLSKSLPKQGKKKHITIANISAAILLQLVKFYYTGKIKLTTNNVEGILRAAYLLEFPRIIRKCANYMIEHLEASNYIILITADDGSRIPAHREILSIASDYFAAMLKGSLREATEKEITINEISGDILHEIVAFCYTGRIKITTTNVGEVLSAARLLQFLEIVKKSTNYMMEHLEPSNCLAVYLIAELYDCKKLSAIAHRCIRENYTEVSKSSDFLRLSKDQLATFLANDFLNVTTEEDVGHSLISWISHDKPNRSQDISHLLPLLRLRLLQPEFFNNHIKRVCEEYDFQYLFTEDPKRHHNNWRKPRKALSCRLLIFCYELGKSNMVIKSYCPKLDKCELIEGITMNRTGFAAAFWEGKLIISGGKTKDKKPVDSIECWDLETKTCQTLSSLNERRSAHILLVVDGSLYAIQTRFHYYISHERSHLDFDKNWCSFERLDSLTGEWQLLAKLPIKKNNADSYFSVTAHNGTIYALDYTEIDSLVLYCYDLLNDCWNYTYQVINEYCDMGCYRLLSIKDSLYLWGEGWVKRYNDTNNTWEATSDIDFIDSSSITTIGDKVYLIKDEDNNSHELKEFDLLTAKLKVLTYLSMYDICHDMITMP